MKTPFSLGALFLLASLCACKKEMKDPAQQAVPALSSSKNGGGGGGNTNTGFISFVGGVFKLIGGNSDSIQVNLTQPAPAGGWTLSLSSSNAAVQVPATFPVPAGTYIVHVPVTSSVVPATRNVVITATLLGQSKSSPSFEAFPLHATFAAPKLQSPGNGSGFKNRLQVKFTWTDDVNAYYHDLQISDSPNFTSTYLDEVYLDDPIWGQSYFNGLGKRYWRVRFIDASGTPGPWSEVRNFEIKQ